MGFTKLDWVRFYTEKLGWEVFPLAWPINENRCSCSFGTACQNIAKHPLIKWKDESSKDFAVAERWFRIWDKANIALRCGARSNVFIIDIDEGGDKTIEELQQKYGPLPKTVASITGSGGYHLAYRPPPGIVIPNKVRIAEGVDIRGDNGYAVIPPSQGALGPYEWDISPIDHPIVDAPEWVISFISASSVHHEENERVAIYETLRGVEEGHRDNEIFRLACRLRHEDFPYEVAEDMVLRAAENCSKPFPPKLAIEKVKRAYETYPASKKWREQSFFQGKKEPIHDAWERPLDFTGYVNCPFPTTIFPKWARDFVEGVAEETQTPVDLAGLITLSALGIACAKRYTIRVKENWEEPLNLYTVVSLLPGERKTSVFTKIIHVFEDYEREMHEKLAPHITQRQNEREILRMRCEKLIRDASKAETPDKEKKLREDADRAKMRYEAITDVAYPRLLADDITPEKMAIMLAEQGGRIGVFSDEGGLFESIAGRYSNNIPNMDIYLKAHSGLAVVRVDRVGRKSEIINSPLLSIGITVQPEVLHGLSAKPGFEGRGLLARFLYAVPSPMAGHRNTDAKSLSSQTLCSFRSNLLTLLRLIPAVDGKERVLTFSPEAQDILRDFEKIIEAKLADDGELEDLRNWGWANKLFGVLCRIIGLLHVAEHCHEDDIAIIPIHPRLVDTVFSHANYFITHARAAHREMSNDITIDDCKKIVRWIKNKQRFEITKQNIAEITAKTGRGLDRLLTVLEDYGYIRIKDDSNWRRGKYLVNPLFLNEEETNAQ